MWRTLGISEHDWQQTPAAVQTRLRSQYHEIHSLRLRSVYAQKQLASLTEPAADIKRLNQRIASQQKQIVHLEQQLTDTARQCADIARLKAEIAKLKKKSANYYLKERFLGTQKPEILARIFSSWNCRSGHLPESKGSSRRIIKLNGHYGEP